MPFDRETLSFSRGTSHGDLIWIEIEPDDSSLRANATSNLPGDNPRPTRHIEDTLTGLRIRRLNQAGCPRSEQTWHHEIFV